MKRYLQIILIAFLIINTPLSFSEEDVLMDISMSPAEFEVFKQRVGRAIAEHPEFKSSQASLKAAYAKLRVSQSSLLPQIKVMLDSNNAISRKYKDEASNIVERSRADHKTNVSFTISQLLYDFGASGFEVSRSESLTKASRAQLSNTILELLYLSIRSYVDVASYANFESVVEGSYKRHQAIKARIQTRVESGMSAGRELSRANSREAEAYAKLVSVRQNLGMSIAKFRIYFPDGKLPVKIPTYPYDLSYLNVMDSKQIMYKNNPQVLEANERFLASKYNTKNVRASTLPRLDLELKKEHYNVTEESDEFDLYSGVNFTYDLYTGGRNEAYKDQAIAEENASLNDRDALLQSLVAELQESVKNLSLVPDRLSAYQNSYLANKQSQFYAQEEFKTSNAVLLDLLQTERDFLDASESMLETLRSSEIQKYSYLKLTGELGEIFEVILN